MASLELRPAGYRIIFRVNGRRYRRSLNTKCEQTAKLALAQLELKLERFKRGDIRVKSGEDFASVFLSAETQPAEAMRSHHQIERQNSPNCRPSMSLGDLLRDYLAAIRPRSIETNTRKMVETHVRHLERIIGAQTPIGEITRECLQRYIDIRGSESGRRGRTISPTTIRKEITTLSAVWKWALAENHVRHALQKSWLQYPKIAQKPPFQTMAQIQRRIVRGALSIGEQEDLWDCLFLTLPEVEELLAHVKQAATTDFIYPLISFAAHTGARRSELLRSEIDDLDYDSKAITIRERKRIKGQYSTRTVPMTAFLADVTQKWLRQHPGGMFTFCASTDGSRVTPDQSAYHFNRTLENSKWKVVRGYHVFAIRFVQTLRPKVSISD